LEAEADLIEQEMGEQDGMSNGIIAVFNAPVLLLARVPAPRALRDSRPEVARAHGGVAAMSDVKAVADSDAQAHLLRLLQAQPEEAERTWLQHGGDVRSITHDMD